MPTNRSLRVVGVLGALALVISIGVFTQSFLAWRAGVEGWRPGANMNQMRSSGTTIALVLGFLFLSNAARNPAAPKAWYRYAAAYGLFAVAVALIVLQFRWLGQR
ncbi:MAG: hypothetical protein IPP90_02885 [Gemmatimonadaceae bacterium]|nr:hypothetical protein [Gemmatimonadaceae bacterium]